MYTEVQGAADVNIGKLAHTDKEALPVNSCQRMFGNITLLFEDGISNSIIGWVTTVKGSCFQLLHHIPDTLWCLAAERQSQLQL